MVTNYGYRAGMTQVSLQLNLSVKKLPKIDLNRIDRWLEVWFGTQVPPLETVMNGRISLALSLTPFPGLLTRVLAIYGLLCRASDMPCVESGRVLRLESRADQWHFALLVPVVNGLPSAVFAELVQHALNLAVTFMRTAPSFDQAQRCYEQIDQQILRLYRQTLPDGRANCFVAELAHKLKVPFEHLGMGLMQLGHGARAQTTLGSACREDSAQGARICADKYWCAMVLAQAGLPVPVHALVASSADALLAAQRLGWPVVVKPADRERGEGVSIDVSDAASLSAAFEKARALSQRVLVEQMVPGVCHRIYIAGGRLVFAVRRLPKSVRGDGQKTVQQLVDEANAAEQQTPPWLRKKPFLLDELGLACLAHSGLEPQTVLKDGQLAPLRPISTTEWGGVTDDVSQVIHPDNVSLAIQAASIVGLSVVGVDLMSEDITRPWHETGAVINELNFTPYMGNSQENDDVRPFLQPLIQGDGRIPLHVVMGSGDLWSKGRSVSQALAENGTLAHLCASEYTESPSGDAVPLACKGLFLRCTALLRRRDVEAIVVVVDSPEFLKFGLPFDQINEIHLVGDALSTTEQAMLDLLSLHVARAGSVVCEMAEGHERTHQ